MKQSFFILLLLLSLGPCYAQQQAPDLSQIHTVTQAEGFIRSNPEWDARLFTIEPGQDLAEISPTIFTKDPGHSFKVGDYSYKIVGIDSVLSFRVSYIFLDGSNYSRSEADQTMNKIIRRYRSGEKFTALVKAYTMDSNKTGDTNWFTENMMVEEFEKAVRAHKKGEIFTVVTPGQNWYHVVLKTHDDTYIKKLSIFKAKSGG